MGIFTYSSYTEDMMLTCPVCGKELIRDSHHMYCNNNHSFDIARQGYVNLLLKQSKDHGDNKDMVQARSSFLDRGAYSFLRQRISEIVLQEHPHTCMDLACGEGYYTKVLQADEKYGFDLSKDAIKHAAGKDKTTQYVISSIFHLPVQDNTADLVLTCFAPFAKEEVERILKQNGLFIFVSPGPRHLIEMKSLLYEHPYENDMEDPDTSLTKETSEIIEKKFHADHTMLQALFQMTPYAYRTGERGKKRLAETFEMNLTAQFLIRTYRKV